MRLQQCTGIRGGDDVHAAQRVIAPRDKRFALIVPRFTAAQALDRRVKAAAGVEEILNRAELAARHGTGLYLLDPLVRMESALLRRIQHASVLHALLRKDVNRLACGLRLPANRKHEKCN